MSEKSIEQRLKETADTIETAIADIKENKATKKEVLDLIEERTKTDKELIVQSKADIAKLNSGILEANAAIGELKQQLRNLKNYRANQTDGNGRYKGHFSSPQEAKAFTLLVMAACLGGNSEVKDRYDAVHKSLEGMGLEPLWVDEKGHIRDKTMTGSSQTGGGALITVEQVPSIIMLLEKYGIFRANALPMPMGAGQTEVPKIDGLLEVTCPGEGQTITAKDPDVPMVVLNPRTMSALTLYSLELEEDSMVSLGELLAGLFARSFAYYEDKCAFLGDGTSTYFGFKGITGALMAVSSIIANIKSLVVGDGNAYNELTLANFESVPGILPDSADDGDAAWYTHRYFFWTVMIKLALTSTSMASEVILGAGARVKQFLGYPVNFTQVMPKAAANSQICALLANLRQGAILGTRGGMEFAQSSHAYFSSGKMAIRGRNRIAINIHGTGYYKDANTAEAGPICGLITAAS